MQTPTPHVVTCVDINGNTYPVPASDLQWRPAVYGIVIKDGALLLSKQFGNRYVLPGGGLKLGETPEVGVIREVKEETGIDVRSPRSVGIANSFFQSAHSENMSYQSLLVYFACEYVGGELSTEGFDEDEKTQAELAEWIPLSKLNGLELATTVDFRRYVKEVAKF